MIDKDQMIADLQQELEESKALVGMMRLNKALKTPKKVKDGLKKDGSPDMRQTKGKALAAAAAANTDPPTDRDRYFYATIFDVEAIQRCFPDWSDAKAEACVKANQSSVSQYLYDKMLESIDEDLCDFEMDEEDEEDEEESSPEPSQETTESSQETTEPTA